MTTNTERVERIFTLFMYLTFNRNKDVQSLADMLGVNKSTIYRYIELYKHLGFKIRALYGGVYRIVAFPKEIQRLCMFSGDGETPKWLLQMTQGDEAQCEEVQDTSTYEVLEEFKENCAYTKVPYLIRFTQNARKLIQASKEKKMVRLWSYESDETNEFCDLLVEAYDFEWYFNYLWAYNLKTLKNELFRVTQIGKVEILDQYWTEEKRHKKQKIDVFGTYGHTTTRVKLKLSMRLKNRMLDEHPMSVRKLKQIGESTWWEFSARLCGFRELARFCQGYLNEVEILEGEGLEDYLRQFTEEQLMAVKARLQARQLPEPRKAPALPSETKSRSAKHKKMEHRQHQTGMANA